MTAALTPSFVQPYVEPDCVHYGAQRLTLEQYRANTRASYERVLAWHQRLDKLVEQIRELLAVEPRSEGQLYCLLSEHETRDVVRALGAMVGSRRGAVTTGEVVITGWRGGSELFGLRSMHEGQR